MQTPHHYGQFSLSPEKAHTFSLNSTGLIRIPVNADNGHLFLAAIDRFSWKVNLANADTVCCNKPLLWKVKKSLVDSMSMFQPLKYTG